MKQAQSVRKGRSRPGARKQGNGPDNNRVEMKIKGNPKQLVEKYNNQAREAMQSGDRITAETYHQFADHYQRVINEMRGLTRGLFSGDYEHTGLKSGPDSFDEDSAFSGDDQDQYQGQGQNQGQNQNHYQGQGQNQGQNQNHYQGQGQNQGQNQNHYQGQGQNQGQNQNSGRRRGSRGRGQNQGSNQNQPQSHSHDHQNRDHQNRDHQNRDHQNRDYQNRDYQNRDRNNRDTGNGAAGSSSVDTVATGVSADETRIVPSVPSSVEMPFVTMPAEQPVEVHPELDLAQDPLRMGDPRTHKPRRPRRMMQADLPEAGEQAVRKQVAGEQVSGEPVVGRNETPSAREKPTDRETPVQAETLEAVAETQAPRRRRGRPPKQAPKQLVEAKETVKADVKPETDPDGSEGAAA